MTLAGIAFFILLIFVAVFFIILGLIIVKVYVRRGLRKIRGAFPEEYDEVKKYASKLSSVRNRSRNDDESKKSVEDPSSRGDEQN